MTILTPLGYVQKFKRIPILGDNGAIQRRVSLDTYLINKGQKLHEKSKFTSAVRKHFRKRSGDLSFQVQCVQGNRSRVWVESRKGIREHGVDAFYGKGSPEDIQFTLQIAHLTGLVELQDMQQWCNKHIGIDCSGYVGNYIWHVYRRRRWDVYGDGGKKQIIGPNSGIRTMCKKPYVEHLSEIAGGSNEIFVLATCDRHGTVYKRAGPGSPAHVMLTEPGTWRYRLGKEGVEPISVTVCESVSGGPQSSTYTFKSFKNGIFQFKRGNKNDAVIRVRMHRLRPEHLSAMSLQK